MQKNNSMNGINGSSYSSRSSSGRRSQLGWLAKRAAKTAARLATKELFTLQLFFWGCSRGLFQKYLKMFAENIFILRCGNAQVCSCTHTYNCLKVFIIYFCISSSCRQKCPLLIDRASCKHLTCAENLSMSNFSQKWAALHMP